MRLPLLVRVLFLGLSVATSLPAASLVVLHPPQLWQRAEWRIDDAPSATNNFDPEQIQIDAIFTTPSGRSLTVPAFWFQDFSRTLAAGEQVLTPVGNPQWRIRFTADEAGAYTLALKIAVAGKSSGARVETRFTVADASREAQHGWVRTAADRRYFETSDGRPLRLIGSNVCWGGDARATYDFDAWFPAMRAAGENFARLWFSPWAMGLEHKPGTLNRYDLAEAWECDHVLQLAEDNHIYVLIAMDHHGMFMSNDPAWGGKNNYWKISSPYSVENGGPCASSNEFFTKPEARKLYQKRLRYLLGRYGYSPHLLSWQFFNEIDNSYTPRADLIGTDVVAWHREMGQWLRAHDPCRHLISTSLTGASDRPEYWTMPEMDFTVYHSYGEADPARHLARLSHDFVQRYQKPVMIGEFGTSHLDWNIARDPYLRGFRQGLWGALLGGSVGSSMAWWWEDVHSDDAYPFYAVMHDVMKRAGWDRGTWAPLAFVEKSPPPVDLDEPIANGEPFTAPIALTQLRLNRVSGEAAIASPLAAARSAEHISSYLHGTRNPHLQQHTRLTAWFGERARVVFHVNSVAANTDLLVRIDGEEKLRVPLVDKDGLAALKDEINQEYAVDIPPGKHRIEIAHTGPDWVNLKSLRLERVRPAPFANGWSFEPEAVGLREGGNAVVYVRSQHVAWPAGALRYRHPSVKGALITVKDWSGQPGEISVEWRDSKNGSVIASTKISHKSGDLQLPLPDFDEDLIGILKHEPER